MLRTISSWINWKGIGNTLSPVAHFQEVLDIFGNIEQIRRGHRATRTRARLSQCSIFLAAALCILQCFVDPTNLRQQLMFYDYYGEQLIYFDFNYKLLN